MRLFRPRSATVEAMQYDGTNAHDMAEWAGSYGWLMHVKLGDWLVHDQLGHYLYPASRFDRLYEPVLADSLL